MDDEFLPLHPRYSRVEYSTPEILDRFGSNPDDMKKHQSLVVENGERFVLNRSPDAAFPRRHALPDTATKGELHYNWEHDQQMGDLCFLVYTDEQAIEENHMDWMAHRVRVLRLYYHLNDNTLSLHEMHQENSGCLQGRIFRKQRVPRPDRLGAPYLHWSELNLGMDIDLFGTKYRIANCDNFTRRYMEEHGMSVNNEENIPEDPWIVERKRVDKRKKHMEEKSFVNLPDQLIFRLIWLDKETDFCQRKLKRVFRMTVFTRDHTVSLTEETPSFDGQLFLRRIRLPKVVTREGVLRHYRSWEFQPGVWIDVFGRPMLVVEGIGHETREYISQQYGEGRGDVKCDWKTLLDGPPPARYFFAPEKMVFLCDMEDPPTTFHGMQFLLTFWLNERKVDVTECSRFRKWSTGRHFLSSVETTLGENHFDLGKTVSLFRWKFKIIAADPRTEEYLKSKKVNHDVE